MSADEAPARRKPRWNGPALNQDLIAEVDAIVALASMTKHGRADYPALSKAAGLSGEGLTGITKRGAQPQPETLIKLARYARQFDPDYSVVRLFKAAGWITDDDIAAVLKEAPAPYTSAEIEQARALTGVTDAELREGMTLLRRLEATFERLAQRQEPSPDPASGAPEPRCAQEQ